MAFPDSTPDSATNSSNSTDHGGPSPADSTLCHVVRIYASPKDGEAIADCPTLPDNILAEVLDSVDLFRKPKRWVVHLDALRQTHQLPGLAVWFSDNFELPPLPTPIRDPFEPVLLVGRRKTDRLQSLIEGQASVTPEGSQLATCGRCARRRQQWFWAIPALLLAAFSFVVSPWRTAWWWELLGVQCLASIAALAVVCPYLWATRRWFLIPQGVLARRVMALPTHALEFFTREDSTLLITPRNPFWAAHVRHATRVHVRQLDDRACLALLAAWQSPAPAPNLSQLADYA